MSKYKAPIVLKSHLLLNILSILNIDLVLTNSQERKRSEGLNYVKTNLNRF